MAESATGLPTRALIAMRGYAAGVFDCPRNVQQVPGHESRAAVGEVVLRAAGSRIEIRKPQTDRAQPPGIGLWGDYIAQMLQCKVNVRGTVLCAILVPGNQAATDTSLISVLSIFAQNM